MAGTNCQRHHRFDCLTWGQPELVTAGKQSEDQLLLHQGKVVADALVGSSAKGWE